jgi:multidrug efflux pump subunit AcrA (membrane-fusion protein)
MRWLIWTLLVILLSACGEAREPSPRLTRVKVQAVKPILLALLFLLLVGCVEESVVPPRPVLSVVVETHDEELLGHCAGTNRARLETLLAFRVGDRIARRLVDVGERVKAGELLTELDPIDQQTLLCAREGELADAMARQDNRRISAELAPQVSTLGPVRELAPQADASPRPRLVRLSLEQVPDAFRLGTTILAEVRVPVSKRSRLPAGALFERNG